MSVMSLSSVSALAARSWSPGSPRPDSKVVAVEAELVGGECPYWGCIPSKMFIRAANALAEARRVEKLAGGVSVTPDFAPVAKRIRDEATDNWDDTVAAKRVTDAGATLVRGHGRLVGDRTVEVDGETYVASKGVVLNTGTTASVPPIDGLADTPYWTNREAAQHRVGSGVADRDRRWSDRSGAGSGVLAVRLAGHGARGGATHPRAGGARVVRAAGQGVRGRGHRRPRRRHDRPGRSRRHAVHRDVWRRRRTRPTSCWSPPAASLVSTTSGSTPSA